MKSKIGFVVRKSSDKTVIVEVERTTLHAKFKRYLRKRKKFHVHDAKNECQLGDKVEILETRPISKTKRWKVGSIMKHGLFVEKGVDDTAKPVDS